MTADAFSELDGWLKSALAATAPAGRKRILRDIVRELRRRNQRRMTRQTGPDGEAWEPRKRDKHGRIRTAAKMMVGLRAARRMRLQADTGGATVGYEGSTARIASVHHFGAVDAVAGGGPKVRYPARPLLGASVGDRGWVRRWLLEQLLGK